MVDIYIKKFEPQKMLRDASIAIFGQRRQGKTVLAEDLLYNIQFKRAHILCGSVGSAKSFRKFVYDTYVEKATIARLEELVQIQADRSEDETLTEEEIEMCLVVDDVGFNKKFMRHPSMGELGSNGRQFKMATLVMIQYIIQMPTELRGNLDYIFFTREQSITNSEKARLQYGGLCGRGAAGQAVWAAVMSASTQNKCVLCIDQTISDSDSIEDCYFWYKARFPMPKWWLGDKAYRAHHLARVRAAQKDPNFSVKYPSTAAAQKKRANTTVKQVVSAAGSSSSSSVVAGAVAAASSPSGYKFVPSGSVKVYKLRGNKRVSGSNKNAAQQRISKVKKLGGSRKIAGG